MRPIQPSSQILVEVSVETLMMHHFSIYCLMGSDKPMEIMNAINYPNPFSGGTVFAFELTRSADVKVEVYTVSGRLVKRYEVDDMDAGYNEIPVGGTWDGKDESGDDLANGVYFWRITAEDEDGNNAKAIGKLIIVR